MLLAVSQGEARARPPGMDQACEVSRRSCLVPFGSALPLPGPDGRRSPYGPDPSSCYIPLRRLQDLASMISAEPGSPPPADDPPRPARGPDAATPGMEPGPAEPWSGSELDDSEASAGPPDLPALEPVSGARGAGAGARGGPDPARGRRGAAGSSRRRLHFPLGPVEPAVRRVQPSPSPPRRAQPRSSPCQGFLPARSEASQGLAPASPGARAAEINGCDITDLWIFFT